MKMFYAEVIKDGSDPSYFCVNLKESTEDIDGEVMGYFVSLWLRNMGYGARKTEKVIVRMVKLYLGDGKVT